MTWPRLAARTLTLSRLRSVCGANSPTSRRREYPFPCFCSLKKSLSAKSKAARCWAVSSCKDEVTYKKPLIQTWLNSLCSADERNRGGAGSTAIFLGMRLTSLRRKAELRKRYEVHHFACTDLLDLLGNLNQAIGLPQRGNQPGAVAWKLRDLQLPLVGSH